ncbi:MAG: glycosyltransferase family 2 protein, partial [Nitrosomonadales bacterium]|nr:glycosyltransferase family 2 protein [Nitrosomonadales bacterium]
MITNPPITIGMPVYNGSDYIREAIDSLMQQTFGDFELIISDNASTDDTQSICEQYACNDSRITYIRQSKNLGALANFKFVLDSAKSEYFMWAAADDKWDKTWIEDVYKEIKSKPSMAGFGQLEHIDSNSTKLNHVANGRNLSFEGPVIWRKTFFYLAYEGLGKANLFYALYPRDLLKNINWDVKWQDYQILFSELEYLGYTQISTAKLYKRIHNS